MQLRRLLIGSAAGLMVAAGAHMGAPGAKAADIFVEPVPEPVDFVRICDVFGRGFFFIPGTDICIKIGGLVRADFFYVHHFDWDRTVSAPRIRTVAGVPVVVGTQFAKVPRNKRNDNEFGTLARQTITLDTRQLTDIGLIRTYGDIWFTIASSGRLGENQTGTGLVLRQAFIQIAGDTGTATFGRAPSFFDFFGSITFDTVIPTTHPGGVVNLAAWTQNLGNGVSASLSLEDASTHNRARRSGAGQFGGLVPFPAWWGTGAHGLVSPAPTTGLNNIGLPSPGIHGGQRAPDVVANIRVDQAWGSAQIMGAIHPVRAAAGSGPGPLGTGEPSTKIGWAAGAGLDLNIPGTGIRFRTQGVYSEGAVRYAVHRPPMAPITDGIVNVLGTSIDLTKAWGIHGALTASVAPGWDVGVEAGYKDVDLPGVPFVFTAAQAAFAAPGLFNPVTGLANLDWTAWYVAGQVVWRPVGGFFVGAEVAYEKLDFDAGPSTDRWGGTVRVQRSF